MSLVGEARMLCLPRQTVLEAGRVVTVAHAQDGQYSFLLKMCSTELFQENLSHPQNPQCLCNPKHSHQVFPQASDLLHQNLFGWWGLLHRYIPAIIISQNKDWAITKFWMSTGILSSTRLGVDDDSPNIRKKKLSKNIASHPSLVYINTVLLMYLLGQCVCLYPQSITHLYLISCHTSKLFVCKSGCADFPVWDWTSWYCGSTNNIGAKIRHLNTLSKECAFVLKLIHCLSLNTDNGIWYQPVTKRICGAEIQENCDLEI